MSDTAAASQPWYHSLNRNQWNILLAATLGWLPRATEHDISPAARTSFSLGRCTFRSAFSGERLTQRGHAALHDFTQWQNVEEQHMRSRYSIVLAKQLRRA
jgi:hypothetical protein